MGLFTSNKKKIIEDLSRKSENISNDISKEIDEFHDELISEYNESDQIVSEFSDFVNELKSKLTAEDANKLLYFTSNLSKVKRCAKKGVDAMRELSRNQKKATRETLREYEKYFYMK
jgi:Mg2+ and Co2+ transporter CorA